MDGNINPLTKFLTIETWIYIFPAMLACFISAGLAVYAWRRRDVLQARIFAVMMADVALWSWFTGMLVLSGSTEEAFLWYRLRYISIATVPVIVLFFSIQYIGWWRSIQWWQLTLLFLIPAATQAVIWLFPNYFFDNVTFIQSGGWMLIENDSNQSWFYVHMVYSLTTSLLGITILLISAFRANNLYRWQALAMVAGGLPTLITSAILATLVYPSMALFTPLSFTMMGLVFAWALFQLKLFDIVPIAQNILFELIEDGILVLTPEGDVRDINPAAEIMLDISATRTIGKPLELSPERFGHLLRILSMPEGQANASIGANEKYLEVHIIQISNKRQKSAGRMVVLHDITELYRTRQQLEIQTQENQLLQKSIR